VLAEKGLDILHQCAQNVKPTPVTLGIGDGANDVAMIQTADVGVGIVGKASSGSILNTRACLFALLEKAHVCVALICYLIVRVVRRRVVKRLILQIMLSGSLNF
jgi:P-type E1-E2 ATPase